MVHFASFVENTADVNSLFVKDSHGFSVVRNLLLMRLMKVGVSPSPRKDPFSCGGIQTM